MTLGKETNILSRTITIASDFIAVRNIRKLKAERTKKVWDNNKLADMVGIDVSSLRRIEAGSRLPSRNIYNSLALIFHWELFVQNRPNPEEQSRSLSLGFEEDSKPSVVQKANLNICLPSKMKTDIFDWASKHYISVSTLIEEAIRRFFFSERR